MAEIQLATFYISDVLLGIHIDLVKEICKSFNMTTVPNTPPSVQGVINLRGDVVTLLDLRQILGLPESEDKELSSNLVVSFGTEQVGLCVDSVSDILSINESRIESPPANVEGMDGRFFEGVSPLENEILVILDLKEVLNATMTAA